jgi:hypothetical protein
LVAARAEAGNVRQLIPSLGLATFAAGRGWTQLDTLDDLRLRLTLRRDGGASLVVQGFSAELLRRDPDICTVLRKDDLLVQQWLDERSPPLDRIGTRVDFRSLAAGEPAALAAVKGRIVLVGDLRESGEEDRRHTASGVTRGVRLVAAQIDGLLRGSAIRSLTPLEQMLMLVGAAMAGTTLAIVLRGSRRVLLLPALALGAVACGLLAVAAYRGLLVLAGPHYAVLALVLGAWLARGFQKGRS